MSETTADPLSPWSVAEAAVRSALAGNDASHDWAHVDRVIRNARTIARLEGVTKADELFVIELGALLHDISDYKYSGSASSGRDEADRVLREGVPEAARAAIVEIVDGVSFSKEIAAGPLGAPLARHIAIVQDADRLDAIGAIGIARCFTYGGAKGRPLHDPTIPPRTPEELRSGYASATSASVSPSLNHFHEKLLGLRDRMKTAGGRALASQRHDVMVSFVEQFEAEWAGER